jgi:hypothetical protein
MNNRILKRTQHPQQVLCTVHNTDLLLLPNDHILARLAHLPHIRELWPLEPVQEIRAEGAVEVNRQS